jgi:hypothetical protein
MKNTKLVEEAKLNPTRIYSRPQDVLRDRRLNDVDRLEILTAWERDVRSSELSEDASNSSVNRLHDVVQARLEVEGRVPSVHAAGESRSF